MVRQRQIDMQISIEQTLEMWIIDTEFNNVLPRLIGL